MTITGNDTANTIAFKGTAGSTITINSGKTLAASGADSILMSSASGAITNTIGGAGTLSGSNARALDLFQYDTSGTLAISAAIGGNGTITAGSTMDVSTFGPGLVTFSGANWYNGVTSVNGGTLSVGSDSNLAGNNGTVSVASASTSSATVTLASLPAASTGFAVGSQLLGQTVIGIGTTGSVTLSGNANTNISSTTSEGFATGGPLVLNGGTLQATSSFSLSEANATGAGATNNRAVGLGSAGGTFDVTPGNTLTIPGVIGGGPLTVTDTGTVVLTGVDTYTGNTTVNNTTSNPGGSTLLISGAGQLGGGSYAGNIAIGSSSVFNYSSTAADTLSGSISGSGVLIDSNTGSLTLSGTSTYSGGTTIKGGGTIVQTTANALGTGTVTLGDGSTSANASLVGNGSLGTGSPVANAITIARRRHGQLHDRGHQHLGL